jgi:tetratricopeptide (TPR) repeat protein
VDPSGERDAREMPAVAPSAPDPASSHTVVGAIPAQRPGFQPRPGLLTRLNLTGGESPVVQVLTGRSGAGGTHLAAMYARAKLAAAWRLVAWVNAENPDSLLAGLAAVADAVGLSDWGSGPGAADAGLVVRQWLEADGDRCLLVFDDAEDPAVLRPFIPVQGAARVLITTARESVAALGTSISVGVFSADEALALLDGRTGLADEAGASALAARIGYLPLAVEQAAAVIARQYRGYGAYLRRLQALQVGDYLSGDEAPYPPGVAETVLLSLEVVRGTDQAGVGLTVLEMMAVLSAAGVGRELLDLAAETGSLTSDGRRADPALVGQALARLADQALLTFTVDGQTVIMHRLVAWVIRDELARRERLTTMYRAAASVLEARAEAVARSRDRQAIRELPEQVTALGETAGEGDEQLTRALVRLRLHVLSGLIDLGDSMPQAIVFGEPLAAHLDRMLGPDHPDTLSVRNSLATAYHAAGRTADAIPVIEQILAARERLLGADHPSTLAARNNLASAYRTAGQAAKAIPLFEKNVAACEALLGSDHPRTVASRHSLDLARQDLTQAEIAERSPQQQD